MPPTGYSLVWSDEFNAGESLSSNWSFEDGGTGWGNNELQYYCADGTITLNGTTYNTASVSSDGTLKITAYKVSKSNSTNNKEYISARMNTKQSWKHGYIEMRAKLPVTKGCWSAFWMLPQNGSPDVRNSKKDGGELDIIEHVPNDGVNKIYFSAHSYYTTQAAIDAGDYTPYIHPTTGAEYSYTGNGTVSDASDWHVYSMLWTDEFVRAFIDGEQYYYAPNPYPGQHNLPYWGFDQEFYIKLNLAVGGSWGGTPASNFGTPTYEIDYVRVYQQ